MNAINGRVIKAAIGAFVAMFVLSYLWHELIMGDWYKSSFGNIMRAEQDISMLKILIGYLLMAFLLAYAYPYGYKGGSGTSEGMRFGVLLGLIVALPAAFIVAGVQDVDLSATLVDGIYHVVEIGVGGTVIGLLYGSDEPAAAPAPAPPPPAAPEPPAQEETPTAEG